MGTSVHESHDWLKNTAWWLVPLAMYAFLILSLLGAMLVWFL